MATNDIVLLGAGFSRNWDAPLASEVANSLLPQVGHDPYLQNLLTKHGKNFENALSQIQQEYISSPSSPEVKERLDKLQNAIAAMFESLNAALERRINFEFSEERRFSVVEFLARFNAIFRLNQDLLLELHYEHHVLLANSRHRWDGLQKPGMSQSMIRPLSAFATGKSGGGRLRRRRSRSVPGFSPISNCMGRAIGIPMTVKIRSSWAATSIPLSANPTCCAGITINSRATYHFEARG